MRHGPHIWEKKYTPLNTEHMGEERDAMAEGEAGNPRAGWAELPASPEGGTASRGSLKKEENHTTKGKGLGRRRCPIYTQHCKHTQSILHVLQSGVCMSVSRSVSLGAGSQESCPTTPRPTSLPHPGKGGGNRYGPQTWQKPGSQPLFWLQSPCTCVRTHT